jgi:alpha-aminoadipic semialdehyde synthase
LNPAIGIRREDKNKWERRVPIVPADLADLIRAAGLRFVVQPSSLRAFPDRDFREAGAQLAESLDACGVVLAVKEIPAHLFREAVTYVFFTHTVKGQPYNMAMLRRLLELKCNVIDYERILDEAGRRLIFFGRHAGLAGMIDTLWGLGRRLDHEWVSPNPLAAVQKAHQYADLDAAFDALRRIGAQIAAHGLPAALKPLVVGFAGYGNVSAGAQEMLACLPIETVQPEDLASLQVRHAHAGNTLYKVVFREEHMAQPLDGGAFDLEAYYRHPERFRAAFANYLPYLTVLMNCIYWDRPYPRLVTKAALEEQWAAGGEWRLKVIGDISCDIEGAIEATVKATPPDNPVYVYEPEHGRAVDGVRGRGPVIMAVDNLPCEFSREASVDFSRALKPFLPALAAADYRVPLEDLALPPEIKGALIVYQGRFTPAYHFMEAFVGDP